MRDEENHRTVADPHPRTSSIRRKYDRRIVLLECGGDVKKNSLSEVTCFERTNDVTTEVTQGEFRRARRSKTELAGREKTKTLEECLQSLSHDLLEHLGENINERNRSIISGVIPRAFPLEQWNCPGALESTWEDPRVTGQVKDPDQRTGNDR